MRWQSIYSKIPTRMTVTLDWYFLPEYIDRCVTDGLELNPFFQRGLVWNLENKIQYVEYQVRGGIHGKEIYMNRGPWSKNNSNGIEGPSMYYIIDGLQRITTVLQFLNNEFPIFENQFFSDFEGRCPLYFNLSVTELETIPEILDVYLAVNSTGIPHTPEEIQRIKNLREQWKS